MIMRIALTNIDMMNISITICIIGLTAWLIYGEETKDER